MFAGGVFNRYASAPIAKWTGTGRYRGDGMGRGQGSHGRAGHVNCSESATTMTPFVKSATALLIAAAMLACNKPPNATGAEEAPIPATASPFDALPDGVRNLLDRPFTGDFDDLVRRRAIRVGVTYNRTHYFVD